MLEELLHINPALYNQFIRTLKEYCRLFERKYNAVENSFGFRVVRPDDLIINGTYNTYTATYPCDKESIPYHGYNEKKSYDSRVPINQAVVYFGWKCKLDFGKNGYLLVMKENVHINKIKSSLVYDQQYPQHTYYDIQHITTFMENDKCGFRVFNDSGLNLFGEVYPILYLIGSKTQLNLFEYGEIGMEIEWKDIDDNMDVFEKENKKFSKIESMLSEIKEMYTPFEYVQVKDTPFSSHIEIKARLDPSLKNFLEHLKNGRVCKYCGEKIYSISRFCLNCGCPIDNKEEQIELHKELNKNEVQNN